MATLYIVGNGFDMHHELPTSLNKFRVFANNSSFANAFERYFAFNDTDLNDIWGKLEANLANFSIEDLIEHKQDYYDDDPHEDQFLYEVKVEVDNLTKGLVETLNAYLTLAEKHPVEPKTYLNIDRDCRYINFNFTRTLERHYQVPASNICYIHGMLNCDVSPLIIGHGLEHDEYEPVHAHDDVSHLTEDQLTHYCDSYSVKYDEAMEAAYCYYNISIKDTQSCMTKHQGFLDSLDDIDKIIVLGHSLSDVDHPYFQWINDKVKPDCAWHVSYYGEKEKAEISDKLECIVDDLECIKLFEMSTLLLTNNAIY